MSGPEHLPFDYKISNVAPHHIVLFAQFTLKLLFWYFFLHFSVLIVSVRSNFIIRDLTSDFV